MSSLARFPVGEALVTAEEILNHDGVRIEAGETVIVYFSDEAPFGAGWMLGIETEDGRQSLGLNIEEGAFQSTPSP
jgi:hypothetical protein